MVETYKKQFKQHTQIQNNSNIISLDDLKYFTGGINFDNARFRAPNVKTVTVPINVPYNAYWRNSFDGDINLERITWLSPKGTELSSYIFGTQSNKMYKLKYCDYASEEILFKCAYLNRSSSNIAANQQLSPFEASNDGHVLINGIEVYELVCPDTITIIYGAVLYYAVYITKVTIGKNVNAIYRHAFDHCHSLATIVSLPTAPPSLANVDAFLNNASGRKIYVPFSEDHSILDSYKSATNWSSYASVIFELNEDGTIPE